MDHMNSAIRRMYVNIVITGRAQSDQFHTVFVQLVDDCCVHGIIHKYADSITSPRQFHRIFVQFRFQKTEMQVPLCSIMLK